MVFQKCFKISIFHVIQTPPSQSPQIESHRRGIGTTKGNGTSRPTIFTYMGILKGPAKGYLSLWGFLRKHHSKMKRCHSKGICCECFFRFLLNAFHPTSHKMAGLASSWLTGRINTWKKKKKHRIKMFEVAQLLALVFITLDFFFLMKDGWFANYILIL